MRAPAVNGDPEVFVATPGVAAPDRRGASAGALDCRLGPSLNVLLGDTVTDPVEGEQYTLACFDRATSSVVLVRTITYHATAPVIDPRTLARQASRLLPLLYPAPSTAPPASSTQLVGVRTWLWIDPQDYRTVSATAALPGLSVTATAKPVAVRWAFDDGSPTLDCHGPGTAYDPARPDADQSTDCGHGFATAGAHTVTVTIDWRVTWRGTDGSTGNLPALSRGVTFPVTVEARQAVITH